MNYSIELCREEVIETTLQMSFTPVDTPYLGESMMAYLDDCSAVDQNIEMIKNSKEFSDEQKRDFVASARERAFFYFQEKYPDLLKKSLERCQGVSAFTAFKDHVRSKMKILNMLGINVLPQSSRSFIRYKFLNSSEIIQVQNQPIIDNYLIDMGIDLERVDFNVVLGFFYCMENFYEFQKFMLISALEGK